MWCARILTCSVSPFPERSIHFSGCILLLVAAIFVLMNVQAKNGSRRKYQQPTTPEAIQVLSAEQRLAEIAEILAAGLMRLLARKSSQLLPNRADFFLGSLGRQSGAVAEVEGDSL
jgi:hypothetical protein